MTLITDHLAPGTPATPDGSAPYPHPTLSADVPDPQTGASRAYLVEIARDPQHPERVQRHGVVFTHFEQGSGLVPGFTMEALLSIVQHRLEGYQSGPHAAFENAVALDHVKEALSCLHDRSARIAAMRQAQADFDPGIADRPRDPEEFDIPVEGEDAPDLDEPAPTDAEA